MDAYIKTWLQFVSPLYAWSLVSLIIIGSEYSSCKGYKKSSCSSGNTFPPFLRKAYHHCCILFYLPGTSWWGAGCCVTIWWECPVHSGQACCPFSCGFANISGLLPSLHLRLHNGTSSKLQLKVLLLDQQAQNKAISWYLPSTMQGQH